MRNAESRRGHEEKPPESGKRRKAEQGESAAEAREVSPADRFEVNADRYNDIRDTIAEKRSELKNLKLNELTKGDAAAHKALEGDIENYESQAVVIEKSYGGQANQFVTDAGRLKAIRTEMDLATRKMGAIERVMKRGEFPGGEDAAKAEMDAQAARITRADRELKALKGMYAAEEPSAAPDSGARPVTAETKPKSRKKIDQWMTSEKPGKKPVDAASAKETDDAIAEAMKMSAEAARKQEEAAFEIPVTVEHFDESETDKAIESAKATSAESIQSEPIPLLSKEQKQNMDTMREAAEWTAQLAELERQRGAAVREEQGMRDRLKSEHGVDDPEAALATRATKPLRSFFRRLFNNENDSRRDALLADFDKASKARAEVDAKLNEERNRTTARGQEAMRMRGSSGSRLAGGEGRSTERK